MATDSHKRRRNLKQIPFLLFLLSANTDEGRRETETNDIQLTNQWLTVRLSPKDYAKMIGHSEQYVRNTCMPEKPRKDRSARIELQFATADILADCCKLTVIGSKQKGEAL